MSLITSRNTELATIDFCGFKYLHLHPPKKGVTRRAIKYYQILMMLSAWSHHHSSFFTFYWSEIMKTRHKYSLGCSILVAVVNDRYLKSLHSNITGFWWCFLDGHITIAVSLHSSDQRVWKPVTKLWNCSILVAVVTDRYLKSLLSNIGFCTLDFWGKASCYFF